MSGDVEGENLARPWRGRHPRLHATLLRGVPGFSSECRARARAEARRAQFRNAERAALRRARAHCPELGHRVVRRAPRVLRTRTALVRRKAHANARRGGARATATSRTTRRRPSVARRLPRRTKLRPSVATLTRGTLAG